MLLYILNVPVPKNFSIAYYGFFSLVAQTHWYLHGCWCRRTSVNFQKVCDRDCRLNFCKSYRYEYSDNDNNLLTYEMIFILVIEEYRPEFSKRKFSRKYFFVIEIRMYKHIIILYKLSWEAWIMISLDHIMFSSRDNKEYL